MLGSIEMTNITSCKTLGYIAQEFTIIVEDYWYKFLKMVNITKQSKAWWNEECDRDLAIYWISRQRNNWIKYRKMIKMAKKNFFNSKIQEIILTNKRLWDLMNWIKKHKLPAMEAIKFNSRLYNNLGELWQALHQSYNSAQDYSIELQILEEIPSYLQIEWLFFSSMEFKDSINICNNSSTPRLDYVFWKHFKEVLNDNKCYSNIVNIVNTCINFSY